MLQLEASVYNSLNIGTDVDMYAHIDTYIYVYIKYI